MAEPNSTKSAPPDQEVVRVSARAWEQDRYLAALLAPRTVRQDLLSLAAFAGEIARIPAFVTEPMMGEIRLQWWREALETTDPELGSGHPVADAVRASVVRHALPMGLLMGLIDAQTTALYDEPMADDQALAAHLAKTEGALFELALRIVGHREGSARSAAAYSAGQAYGLARLLVELPALWAQGRTFIPATRLSGVGLSVADVQAGVAAERLGPVLAGLVAEARRHLAEARRLDKSLARAQRVALLPLAVVEPYLRAFERSRRDPLRDPLEISPLGRVWALWRAHMSGRF